MTSLEKLIEIIKDKRKESDISNTLLRFCQVEAEKLLAEEKKQIIEAFEYGAYIEHVKERFDYDHEDYDFNNADEYFDFTFKRNVE